MYTNELHYIRMAGKRTIEIVIGRIHGHRRLGFSAYRPDGEVVRIDYYYSARRQAAALNETLAEVGITGLRGMVHVIAVRKDAIPGVKANFV